MIALQMGCYIDSIFNRVFYFYGWSIYCMNSKEKYIFNLLIFVIIYI